jgi:hypothetical protein
MQWRRSLRSTAFDVEGNSRASRKVKAFSKALERLALAANNISTIANEFELLRGDFLTLGNFPISNQV